MKMVITSKLKGKNMNSNATRLMRLNIPGEVVNVEMFPFKLEDISTLPLYIRKTIRKMISGLPLLRGLAYLTVDRRVIKEGMAQRRGGAHIDGNFSSFHGGNGWKVGGDGSVLSKREHHASYSTETGGMLIFSDKAGCKGWLGEFNGSIAAGGNCASLKLPKKEFMLTPNYVYHANSRFVHESVSTGGLRTLVRITLPYNYPALAI